MAGDKFTVGAVGVGAVGSVVATCLSKAGARIIATDLPHRIPQLNANGLQMQWADELFEYPVDVAESIRSIADAKPDVVLVATKAVALKRIMSDVVEAAGEDCLIVSVHNGIDTEDEIAKHVPSKNVARMVVNFAGALNDEGFAKVVWFNPPNFFGLLEGDDDPRLTKIIDMLNSVEMISEQVDTQTIKKKAFLKTILNSGLMPLCAVLKLTMKEAMEGPATRKLVEDLMHEGLAVAGKLGYDYGDGVFDMCMGYLDRGGDHYPSMCVDLECKKATEIDFINGKILELGRKFEDLNLDVNRVLVSLLMAEEIKVGARAPDDIPDYLLKP